MILPIHPHFSGHAHVVVQSEEDYNHHHHPQTPTQANKLKNVRSTLQKTD